MSSPLLKHVLSPRLWVPLSNASLLEGVLRLRLPGTLSAEDEFPGSLAFPLPFLQMLLSLPPACTLQGHPAWIMSRDLRALKFLVGHQNGKCWDTGE